MYPKRNWIETPLIPIPEDFKHQIGGHPVVLRALINRGFTDVSSAKAFIDPREYSPTPPGELPCLEKAAYRIEQAIQNGERICIWGDFDVDGQTATSLLFLALRSLGGDVIHHIPVRATESHGISQSVLSQIIKTNKQPTLKLLLTCDTGISAYDAIAYAFEHGIETIVTDHHALPERLPDAYSIVNPKFLPEGHKLVALSGVGVAYKLVEELFMSTRRSELSQAYLDLVALGLVADVTPLIGETRYLVQSGLREIRKSPRTGIQVMVEALELDPSNLSEEHLAFIVAPRLNAVGRLADGELAFELLTTDDSDQARQIFFQIEAINSKRRLIENQVFQGALRLIDEYPHLLDAPILVLSNPKWPSGVLGIVASRLVERYHKPVLLISAPINELARGSARSIEGIDIYKALSQHKQLLNNFGGHPMAAGFSIASDRIPGFIKAIEQSIEDKYVSTETNLAIDGFVPLSDLSIEFAEDLERLAPFGSGNTPPILVSNNMHFSNYSTIGRDKEHLLIIVEDEKGNSFKVLSWQGADRIDIHQMQDSAFNLAYNLRSSTYKSKRSLQIEMIDFQSVSENIQISSKEFIFQTEDYRQEHDPIHKLASFIVHDSTQVWAEGTHQKELIEVFQGKEIRSKLRSRYDLSSCMELIIWTIPPHINEILKVIRTVNPKRVYLFACDPELDQLEQFSNRLIGLLKNLIMKRSGMSRLSALAAAMAHQEETILKGLEWFGSTGIFQTMRFGGDEILVESGGGIASGESSKELKNLKALLIETAAFRGYYRRVDKGILMKDYNYP